MTDKFDKGDSSKRRKPGPLFPDAAEDRERAHKAEAPSPAQAQIDSPSYRLAYDDLDFLVKEELRPVRLLLELTKPELKLKEHGIERTVVIFGSARTPPDNPFYIQAREMGAVISRESGKGQVPNLHIVTGGGPGIMEAANRGAQEAGFESIGLNIVIPYEQYPNPHITPELCFRFHYFAIRKMHFLLRARALVAFPGGFGTLDEVFEALTLIQTGKIEPFPVLLFGRKYWQRLINFEALAEENMVDRADLDHFKFVDSVDEAWEIIRDSLES